VIAVSVYADQAESVDRAAEELLQAGFVKASRSFVIQAAIQRLREDLEGKNRAEILKYFLERQIRKPPSPVAQRNQNQSAQTSKLAESSQR
jgi:hypothetical protein